jgi:hypothetical protein
VNLGTEEAPQRLGYVILLEENQSLREFLTMDTERINDVRAFRSFLDEKLSNGEVSLTLDEALGLWEYENASDAQREEARAAITQGLADVESGRTRPFEEFDREFRRKHGLSTRT